MRKQDRIAAQQNNQQPSGREQRDQRPQQEPRNREQMKGSAATSQPQRSPRQPGKLPLPD